MRGGWLRTDVIGMDGRGEVGHVRDKYGRERRVCLDMYVIDMDGRGKVGHERDRMGREERGCSRTFAIIG